MKQVINGKIIRAEDMELADKVVRFRREKGLWEVIDLLVEAWAKRAPEEVKAFKIQIEDYRESLDDRMFGQTAKGKHLERRFTLSFPQALMLLIRTQYKVEELPFDAKFFAQFAKRYPFFRVAEKG